MFDLHPRAPGSSPRPGAAIMRNPERVPHRTVKSKISLAALPSLYNT